MTETNATRAAGSSGPACSGFRVGWRNYGHWDIYDDQRRMFRVRGGPGKYCVIDERPEGVRKDTLHFATVGACMGYICDTLMWELIVAEGQTPRTIESWNV